LEREEEKEDYCGKIDKNEENFLTAQEALNRPEPIVAIDARIQNSLVLRATMRTTFNLVTVHVPPKQKSHNS
jgi:hypothetical protein